MRRVFLGLALALALALALLAVACDDDGGCPALEEEWDCVDYCTGRMTGAVCHDGAWACPDDCHPCDELYPGEVCLGAWVSCQPSADDLAACPTVLCRECLGWSGEGTDTCACACDGTTGEVRCGPAGAGG